jgi:DnaJ-class molecular chaperone
MKNKRNYYRILHVQPDAPQAIIKSSYRTLMHRLGQHPDLGGEHWNAALINDAYAVISDPRKRAEYDRTLLQANAPSSINGQRGKVPTTSVTPRNQSREYRHVGQDVCAFCGLTHRYGKNPHQDAVCSECASPLKHIEKLRLEKSCRRMVHRTAKRIQLVFYTAWPQKEGHTGLVQDISPKGMQFVTKKPPKTGMHIKVECETCTAVARVTNYEKRASVTGMRWVVGVEFVTILFRQTRGSFVSMKI